MIEQVRRLAAAGHPEIVLIVLLIFVAIGAFIGAEKVERMLAAKQDIAPPAGSLITRRRAFAAIARTGSGGSQVVAMGVSEALLTTAAGIIVAVIATVFFNVFVRRIRSRVAQLEDARETWFSLVHQYQRQRRGAASPAAAASSSMKDSRAKLFAVAPRQR